jgi:hypothetical protein
MLRVVQEKSPKGPASFDDSAPFVARNEHTSRPADSLCKAHRASYERRIVEGNKLLG